MTKILFFGRLGDRFGREIEIDLPSVGCTTDELRGMICSGDRAARDALCHSSVKICVDQAIVSDCTTIFPGQEIAFLPPLSGG